MRLKVALAALALALLAPAARADLNLTLDTYSLTGSPGEIKIITGLITNTGAAPMWLDGGFANTLYGDAITTKLFEDFPQLLDPGQSVGGDLAKVVLGNLPSEICIGFYSLDEDGETELFVDQEFVEVVPEPGSIALLAGGLVGGLLVARRRRK